MYRSKTYHPRPLDDLFAEIEELATDWPDARRIFLADGDALALDSDHLLKILKKLHQCFPKLTRISCYATPSNIMHKSIDELRQLQEQKLNLLYLGIESGDNEILKKIHKGANQQTMVSVLDKAAEAQMKISATVILGLGGQQYWQQHIDGTIELLNRAPVSYLSTLQLYLEPNIEHEFYTSFGGTFKHQDDMMILKEQQRLLKGLHPPKPVIFRSNHASNALALVGTLPKDRDLLLQQIDEALTGHRVLRPEYLRGM